jgi:hypothetical protein
MQKIFKTIVAYTESNDMISKDLKKNYSSRDTVPLTIHGFVMKPERQKTFICSSGIRAKFMFQTPYSNLNSLYILFLNLGFILQMKASRSYEILMNSTYHSSLKEHLNPLMHSTFFFEFFVQIHRRHAL